MEIERLPAKLREEDVLAAAANVPENLRLSRAKVGLSQQEMALRLGYESATALSLMETGQRKVSALTLWKIARITGEPVQNFFLKGLI